ncbi:MAG: hypothetical protein GF364_00390 [Candidatus Lokiarchaeota archaeon]|nr:hypothetical protein [Candidatus Lokiarchaeota archaeon]
MVRYSGKLTLSDDGLIIYTNIAGPSTPEDDIPLKELFYELLDQDVTIEIHRLKEFPEIEGDK